MQFLFLHSPLLQQRDLKLLSSSHRRPPPPPSPPVAALSVNHNAVTLPYSFHRRIVVIAAFTNKSITAENNNQKINPSSSETISSIKLMNYVYSSQDDKKFQVLKKLNTLVALWFI